MSTPESDIKPVTNTPEPVPTRPHRTFLDTMLSTRGIVCIVLIAIVLSLGAYFFAKKSFPTLAFLWPTKQALPTPIPIPTPTSYPIFQGKQVFHASHTQDIQGPLPSTVTVDPYDPKRGEQQIITIALTHTSPITSVAVTLESDHKSQIYPLQRISGTDVNGEWQTTITTNDTHDYIYRLGLDFQSTTSSYQKKMIFRVSP